MAKTVETALPVNILKLCKTARDTHSNVLKLEWVFGSYSQSGIALLTEEALVVIVEGRPFQTGISWREFRKDRFQPHIQCRACAKQCHMLYVEGGSLQCRRCAGLIYESQRGHAPDRAYLKTQKIIARLGGQPGQMVPPRPPRMWRRSYYRHLQQLADAQRAAFGAMLSGRSSSC